MTSQPTATKLEARATLETPHMLLRYRDALALELRSAVDQGRLGIHHMLRYHLGASDDPVAPLPGKALRPALCLFACEVTSGTFVHALPAAVALELTHNFSLIHDDIQDGDIERRHRPALWYLWDIPQALAAGDAMCGLADVTLSALLQRGVSPERVFSATAVLTQGRLEMIVGQYLDMSFEGRLDITVPMYLDMISKKTGALMEASTRLGALIGSEDSNTAEAFGRCGRLLGLAFQIRDDILGTWGLTENTGKPLGNDIRRRKKTLPVIYTLEHAQTTARDDLERIYRKETLGETDVEQVLLTMKAVGAQAYAQRLVEEKCYEALEAVAGIHIPKWGQEELKELATFLLARDH